MLSMTRYLRIIGVSVVACCLLSGCSHFRPYRMEVEQGRQLDQHTIESLAIGMTKSEVQSLIGLPLLEAAIPTDRWEYVHFKQPGYGPMDYERTTLYFNQGQLSQVEQATYSPTQE